MATIKTNAYSSRYLAVDLSVSSQSTANNTSVVKWRLYGAGGSSSTYIISGNFKLVIGGVTRYSSSSRINLYNGTTVASGSFTVTHNNNGTKSLGVSLQAGIYTIAVNCKGSGTFTLPTIPRGTSITSFSLDNRTLNTFRINYSMAHTCDRVEYSLNGGSWALAQSGDRKSGSCNVTGRSPNSTYRVKVRARRKDSQMWVTSGEKSITTYQIAQVTSAPNINIGQSHTVAWSNPSGAAISLALEQLNGSLIQNYGSVNGTNLITEPPADLLYSLTPNSNNLTLRYKITTTQNGSSYNHYKDVVFYVIESNPTFLDFRYSTANPSGLGLSATDRVVIQKVTGLGVSIDIDSKMETLNYATPVKYELEVDGVVYSEDYRESDISFGWNKVSGSGSKMINVSAIDSRGNVTTVSKEINVIEYEPPTLNATAKRLNGFEDQVTLKCSGTYSKVEYQGRDLNSMLRVLFYYGEVGGPKSYGGMLSVTVDDQGNYQCGDVIMELDNASKFEFRVFATDRLMQSIEANPIVQEGIPLFFISDSHKAVGVNCIPPDDAEKGSIWTNGNKVPDGAELNELAKRVDFLTESQKILWSGRWYMSQGHVVKFKNQETGDVLKISDMPNGIILVWAEYKNGAVTGAYLHHQLISKYSVSLFNGNGHAFLGVSNTSRASWMKYVYVYDDKIVGYNGNHLAPNNAFVLVAVLGF